MNNDVVRFYGYSSNLAITVSYIQFLKDGVCQSEPFRSNEVYKIKCDKLFAIAYGHWSIPLMKASQKINYFKFL